MDIGEDKVDILIRLKDRYGLVRTAGLEDIKSSVPDDICGIHAEQRIVLDYKDNGGSTALLIAPALNTV